jgi:hypothetical protein
MNDNDVRAIFEKASADGIDDLNTIVTPEALKGQPQAQTPAPVEVPAKFQKPDGTVDEEKLKASSARLDEANKTVDELLADYKAKEKEYHEKSAQVKQVQSQIPGIPQAQAPLPPDAEAVRQQLLQLQQQDPIAFAVEIARAVSRKEATDIAAPALQVAQVMAEQQRDGNLRTNIAKLAEQDPRILNPQVYAEFQKELNDPSENYYALKNPHKAAWNEVKGRLRLGEPTAQAQPSNPSPMLGRGLPTSVQGLSQPQTPQSMFQQASNVNPLSEDGKRFEAMLREASGQVWKA